MTTPESPAEMMRRGFVEINQRTPGEQQAAARRAGEAFRVAIDRLTATSAPTEVLDTAAGKIREVIALLDGHGQHRSYFGVGELSGSGRALSFFDWSPEAGSANPLAPPIRFEVDGDAVVGRVRFGAAYEGPPGCAHGGHVAAAFDEVLGLAQSLSGQMGMTASLTVKYRRPTPLHTDLRCEGRLESVNGRKVLTSGLMFAEGQVTAEASGLFVSVPPEQFAALMGNR